MCRLCHVVPKMGDLIHIYEGKAFSGFTPELSVAGFITCTNTTTLNLVWAPYDVTSCC